MADQEDPSGPRPIAVLGSMATRGLLAELAAAWDGTASVVSVGGVEAVRRMRQGGVADVLVLSGDALRALETEGVVLQGSLAEVAISSIAVAVRDGDAAPDLTSAEGVRRAILAAPRTGYSTGPSGEHLLRLLDEWGLRDALGDRLVQAPPGMPVGRLLAEGAVDLAFQQNSELIGVPGTMVAGLLPPAIANDAVFTAAIPAVAPDPEQARRFIAYITSRAHDDAKRRFGMQPV